ncbi:hypothetical protein [Radiobacillus sp. PE A8.2]
MWLLLTAFVWMLGMIFFISLAKVSGHSERISQMHIAKIQEKQIS